MKMFVISNSFFFQFLLQLHDGVISVPQEKNDLTSFAFGLCALCCAFLSPLFG